MKITYDPAKRDWTLQHRGLDFDDAEEVFAGVTVTIQDTRFDYPERRFVTFGILNSRIVVVVWTPEPTADDADGTRVISMRRANARERTRYQQQLGQSGRNH